MKINKKVIGEILQPILTAIAFAIFITWTLLGAMLIVEVLSGNIPERPIDIVNTK